MAKKVESLTYAQGWVQMADAEDDYKAVLLSGGPVVTSVGDEPDVADFDGAVLTLPYHPADVRAGTTGDLWVRVMRPGTTARVAVLT